MDRRGISRTHHPQAAEALRNIIQEHGLIDTWRVLHPGLQEGTCITTHHGAWSRIDFWLLTPNLQSWVHDVTHQARTLSDHFPVLLYLNIPAPYRQPFSWRLPHNALLDPVFREHINQHIIEFFSINKGSVNSLGTLWDAFKSVIQRHCIAGQARVLRDIRTCLSKLETELHGLEQQYYREATATTIRDIRLKVSEYQDEAERELRFQHKHATARRYGEGDRPSKTLAYLLRPARATTYITSLHQSDAEVVHSPPAILAVVRDYYAKLYTAQATPSETELEHYFDSIALVWLDNERREYLDEPYTVEDIKKVIGGMQADKAPGPDVLTV